MKEADLCPVEGEEVEVVPLQEVHIIKQTWMTLLMTLHYLLYDRQDHLSPTNAGSSHPQMVEKIREVGQLNHP